MYEKGHQSLKSVKSLLSGPSYFSDENYYNLQLDEQIATHTQFLKKLKKLKLENKKDEESR